MIAPGMYLPSRLPTVLPTSTPGILQESTAQAGAAARAWIAAPTTAVMARVKTLVAMATRGGDGSSGVRIPRRPEPG